MNLIRVLLADDHEIVRRGVRSHLDGLKDVQVVGEAENGLALLDLVDRLRPDVVVADIEMEGLNGLDALEQALKRYPKLGTVILSMHDDLPYIKRALRYGIHGFVSKLDKSKDVINAVRCAVNHQRYLSPRAKKRVPSIDVILNDDEYANPLGVLTNRQRQVFQIIAEGNTNAEAAEILGISVRTVEVHRAQMMKRLNLRNQIELIKFATRHGVISKE